MRFPEITGSDQKGDHLGREPMSMSKRLTSLYAAGVASTSAMTPSLAQDVQTLVGIDQRSLSNAPMTPSDATAEESIAVRVTSLKPYSVLSTRTDDE